MITGFDNSETGTRELTINYKGKQTSWSMTVKKPSASDITSIVLSGRPKTTYSENQKFDPSGASFFATIGGRYVYIYSGFSYDKTGPLKPADTSVIFNYFGKEIPVNITVTARKATKLSVLAAPAKTQFTVGNTLDLSGVKLQITYNDGTQTPIFKADELEKYGVHVAFGKNGSFTTVAADKVLESADSGSTIVFYATDKLPSEYGSVVVASSTITVRSPLTVPALDLYVSAGKSAAQYPCTDNVTGGSGTYATTVIEEKLPTGLNRTNLPGGKYNAFSYTGVVTASAGDYSSQYKISDTETQESIQVTVTIHVVPSDQAAFYSFVLKKVENPGLKQDVIGAIGEDTIVLRVPSGTNVTELKPSIDYGSGMGTELPSGFWNGSKHDFTSPVVYTLTAPDGVTKKSYTVSVEFYDDTSEEVQSGDEILSPADNTKISCKDSEEITLKGWAGDSSKEISLFKYVVNGISYTTSANSTTQTIPNARAYEVKISGSSLKEGNNTLEIWVMYADNSGTGSGGTLKKLGTRTVVKEGHKAVKDAAVAATCETAGKTEGSHCSVCNTVIKAQTTVAALGHNWDSGKVTKAATCTATGTKTYTCSRCKKTRTETIAATGHKEVKDAAVAATCETTGKTEGSHCSVCNTVIKAQTTVAALGHSWDGGKVAKAATCTAAGTKTYTCTRCKKTRTETIAATGHKVVKDTAVAATCETTGKTEGSHCSVCGTVLKAQTTVAALGHSWDGGKITKAATCTAAGTKTYTCTRCKKTRTETIAATGHKAVKDAAVAATCETTGKTEGSHCSVCGTVLKAQTTVAALGHSWDNGKVTKAVTCTAAGTKTYTCTRCKKTRTETIAATGHKAVKDAAVAATCETTGKTEGSHCSVCNTVIKAQATVAALGHSWDGGKITKAATCTAAGTKTYTCTRCKKTRTETIAATGHKAVKDAAVAATCETTGKTEGSHCSVCGTVLKAQTTTAALGHSWDNGKVTKAATCTATGTKTYTCTRCKKTRTETIAATGHKAVKDAAVVATCETAGKTEGSHCSVCNTVLKAQTTVAALGHSWDGGKITKAATCTAAGTKTYTCTRCKKTRTETIVATGHKVVKDAAVAATCETTGKTEGSHCSVCGTVLKAQTTVAALGHDYGEWKTIKAATYTEPGQAERVCRRNASHKEYRQLPVLEKAKIDLSACSIQLSEQTYVYDGTEKTPTVTITYNEKTLTEGKDYQVYFADNVNPGTAKITVIAKTDSDYTGTATITFEIRKSLPENATVIEPGAFSNCTNLVDLNIKENVTEIGDNAFADSKNLQNIYFYGNSPKLGNNIFKNVTATVYYPYTDKTWSLDILRDYGGNITWVPWDPKTGSPAKRSLALCDIRITEQKYTYDGTEKTPEMVIMDGNYTLQKNTDYTVKCSNNINAGNAELEITGAGNYSGTYKAGFLIEQTEPSLKFDKKTITVKYGTKPFLCVLSEKTTDGTITYSSSNPKVAVVDPTTGKVTIKGGGTAAIMAYAAKGTNYTSGSTFCTIKVTKRSNTIKASNIRRTWYAKARKISINAKASGKAPLKYSSSSKSVKVDKQGRITIAAKFTGSARITIRSSATAGYNAATKSITVTVDPAGTTLTTAKNLSGRKAQITWKKNRYVTGYEIQYSVNKNFRSGSKKTVSGVSKTKYTLTKLQKNKTYYVRIRTYKKSGTKKYYSSWSKVKAVRIRK